MKSNPHLLRPYDQEALWSNLAAHLRTHPEDLTIAMDNLDRWEQWGRTHPAPIREWRQRILAARQSDQALEQFLDFLSAPDVDESPLKSCSPFVGILPSSIPCRATGDPDCCPFPKFPEPSHWNPTISRPSNFGSVVPKTYNSSGIWSKPISSQWKRLTRDSHSSLFLCTTKPASPPISTT